MAREQVPSPLPETTDGESVARVAAPSSLSPASVADDDDSVFRIYCEVDSLLCAEQFATVDAMLAAVAVNDETVVDLLARCSITRDAIEHLPSRPAFVARVRQRLTATDPEQVDDLLSGIE